MRYKGDAARAVIEEFAEDYPDLAPHLRQLADVFLRKGVLKDNRSGPTNDFAFNDGRDFATLTATPCKWDKATEGRLQVQVYHEGGDGFGIFVPKSKSPNWEPGWYKAQLASDDDIAPLLEDLRIALSARGK